VIGLAVVAATVISYAIAWTIHQPLLVPVLNTLASFPFMVAALRRGRIDVAVVRMLLWALAMAVCATLAAYVRPWEAGRLFIRGDAYRTEMFVWVMSGRGPESTPSQFIPQQAGHAAMFAALALLTGGIVAMPMGAVLMNYMGTYVGSLAAAGGRPLTMMIVGWHPWAVIRIASFVVLGVVLSTPLLSRVLRFRIDRDKARALALAACAGLVLDVVMKWLLAPAYQRMLLRLVGW
jgi:hypothetical protein